VLALAAHCRNGFTTDEAIVSSHLTPPRSAWVLSPPYNPLSAHLIAVRFTNGPVSTSHFPRS